MLMEEKITQRLICNERISKEIIGYEMLGIIMLGKFTKLNNVATSMLDMLFYIKQSYNLNHCTTF